MRNYMKHAVGFTLVELMIALAMLGILISIGIPAYSSYITRTKISEALSFSRVAKLSVSDYYQQNGHLPDSNAQAGLEPIIEGSNVKSMNIESSGVIKIVVEYAAGQTGTLTLAPVTN